MPVRNFLPSLSINAAGTVPVACCRLRLIPIVHRPVPRLIINGAYPPPLSRVEKISGIKRGIPLIYRAERIIAAPLIEEVRVDR